MNGQTMCGGDMFGIAVERYADTLFRVSYQYLFNRQDAEDVVQDVFLALVARLQGSEFNDDEHLKAWLIRVTINKSINVAKSNARRRTQPPDMLSGVVENPPSELEEQLARLSADDREVSYLHYYEGYSAAEIAAFLNVRENAVYKRLSRARERLKNFLEED